MTSILRHSTGFLALILLTLCGCTGVYDRIADCPAEGDPQLVRISAQIIPSHTPLRADGDVQVDPDGKNKPFEPQIIAAETYENRIDHVMLYVYRRGELVKTIFYHDPNLTVNLSNVAGMDVKTFGRSSNQLTFELELPMGTYRFILLANDPAVIKEAKTGNIRNPKKIYVGATPFERGFLSSSKLASAGKDYTTDAPRLIPMVGQAMLTIPKGVDGSTTDVTPTIDIERVMARVDFYLTTAKEDGSAFLKPEMESYTSDTREPNAGRLTKGLFVDLFDHELRAATYEVLPHEGEYTATGKGMQPDARLFSDRTPSDFTDLFKDITTYRSKVGTLYSETLDPSDTYKGDAGTNGGFKFAKVVDKQAVVTAGSATVKYSLYIPPMDIVGAEEKDMPYILIGVNPTGEAVTDAKAMNYFRLPITTLLPDNGGESFTIRRNTIYQIHARMEGKRLILDDGIKVYPWREVKDILEVNPDDEGVDPLWN